MHAVVSYADRQTDTHTHTHTHSLSLSLSLSLSIVLVNPYEHNRLPGQTRL